MSPQFLCTISATKFIIRPSLLILKAICLYPIAYFTPFQRYLQSMQMLDNLEQILITKEKVDLFRSHESYQKFLDKWNIAAYFQIRYFNN